jgi:cell shape-determining protein MreD
MYKLPIKLLLVLILGTYIFLICLVPLKLYKLGLIDIFGQIFPALDVVIIYYFSTYTNVRYWMLFIIGIILDHVYQIPVGLNSFIFITSNILLNYISRWFILKDEITNVLIFYAYSGVIIGFRYIIFLTKNNYGLEGFSIYFYYLTTIFSYPILRFLIHKPLTALTRYAG